MRTYEELKAIYDKKSIQEIETFAKGSQAKASEFYVSFLESLWYLERSGRYTENPKYAKSRFKDYISFEFGIRHSTFRDHRHAYQLYSDMATRHSPNLYAKTKQACGEAKVPMVFKAINAKEQTLKRPVRKEEIQEIINKYRKPGKATTPKPDVATLKSETAKYQAEARKMEKANRSKDEQIAKLRQAVKKRDSIIEKLEKEKSELLAKLSAITAQFRDTVKEERVAVQ